MQNCSSFFLVKVRKTFSGQRRFRRPPNEGEPPAQQEEHQAVHRVPQHVLQVVGKGGRR